MPGGIWGSASETLGNNRLSIDSWGRQKVYNDFSILHGVFTFEVSDRIWKKLIDGAEVIDGSADTKIKVEDGKLVVLSDVADKQYTLNSLRHPRYQPNKGHLYSDSGFVVNPGAGKLYAVLRTTTGSTVADTRKEIDYSINGVDMSKGNIFDIQMQWRGVGNFTFFINLKPVYATADLGERTNLSISNPALPFLFEAVKGAHTIGGVARSGSAVRWGIGNSQNAVFFEFEYEDTRDARRDTGCCDIVSEGGRPDSKTYGSVSSGQVQVGSDLEPAIVIRLPANRTVNGNTLINTRDLLLSRVFVGANNEHAVSVWLTRDPTAFTVSGAGQVWAYEPNNDVEYVINDDSSAAKTVSIDTAKARKIFETIIEQDQPVSVTNPNGQNGELYLTAGDYLAVCFDYVATGNNLVNATIEWGAEI